MWSWPMAPARPSPAAPLLDGFIITAGQANGDDAPDYHGGGFYCDGSGSGSECSPSLRNITFSGNYAGIRWGDV